MISVCGDIEDTLGSSLFNLQAFLAFALALSSHLGPRHGSVSIVPPSLPISRVKSGYPLFSVVNRSAFEKILSRQGLVIDDAVEDVCSQASGGGPAYVVEFGQSKGIPSSNLGGVRVPHTWPVLQPVDQDPYRKTFDNMGVGPRTRWSIVLPSSHHVATPPHSFRIRWTERPWPKRRGT